MNWKTALLGLYLTWSTLDVVPVSAGLPKEERESLQDDGSSMVNSSSTHSSKSNDATVFRHFIAHNDTMTCSADEHALPFNNQIRGVNMGGWLVLEPWITPSLFYQFLGGNETTTAFDMYTFCEVLGPKEANRQLRRHWDTWVTEDIIKRLAESNAVNSLRLPVSDAMYKPYGPYLSGCLEGALDYVDLLLDYAYSYGLSVLIDIHTMRDSQNGFDNSGQSMGFGWTSALSSEFTDQITFQHWPVRTAKWIGHFDPKNASYSSINHENIRHGLDVIQEIVDRYAQHPAVLGLEPVNEPWQYTPIDELKRFYWEGYLIVKRAAPYWKYIMHDSFRFDPNIWGGFMDGCPERAMDTHSYQAWRDPDSRLGYYTDACRQKAAIAAMERAFGPVVVGEFSLATDNCAMWLNGFNDNLPGFPRLPCKYTICAEPYMGTDQPGTPVDPAKPLRGPFGTGLSGPIFGLCPGSRDWIKERTDPLTGQDWIKAPPQAPKHLDDTDDVMSRLALKKINAFSGIGHGFYFWNFRTDLYEPQWSYMAALDRGWIPKGNLADEKVINACLHEDDADFQCVLKRNQIDKSVRDALAYILGSENRTGTLEGQKMLNSTGSDLQDAANKEIMVYFEKNRHSGATCDFGGVAMLLQYNRTLADDDTFGLDDDEYYGYVVYKGPSPWILGIVGFFVAIVSALLGFVLAMRYNKKFNRRVRSTALFKPLSRSSLVRSTCRLEGLEHYEEIKGIDDDINRSHPSF